jgi:membrane fusion protein, multidrug efflux system
MGKKIIQLALMCLIASCQAKDESVIEQPKTVAVRIITPTVQDITLSVESLGKVLPSASFELRPRISGVLQEVYVKEGQQVEKGSPLFKIDPATYLCKEKQLKAELHMHEAELNAYLKKQTRYQGLATKELIAKADWDALETTITKAQGQIALDEAKLQEIALDCDRCTLYSPIKGRVGKIAFHAGHHVTEAQVLGAVLTLDPLVVEFGVTESEFPKILGHGRVAEVALLTAPQVRTSGPISFIDSQFDSKTAQLLVFAEVLNPEVRFRPGHLVKVKVEVDTIKGALLVPERCIEYDDRGPHLYLVDDDARITVQNVKLGASFGDMRVITSGLNASDKVIASGNGRVAMRTKVSVQI